MRYAARIEYDGSRFCGWQRQKGPPSVQQHLEEALSHVADEAIIVHTAGRTDTGVHATSQFVHFDTEAERQHHNWMRGVNTQLPEGVSMTWMGMVSTDFHARFSALKRHYRYIIFNRDTPPTFLRGRVTWQYAALDLTPMQEAARRLLGKHDFSAFRAASCQSRQPIKTVYQLDVKAVEVPDAAWVWIDVVADGFLHHMVRNIAGVLMKIGSGEAAPEWASAVLKSGDRTQGGVTAPPDGLYFTAVEYPAEFSLPRPPAMPCYW